MCLLHAWYKFHVPTHSHRWRRLVRKRVGADQIRVDICYIAPGGRRLRTFPEIQSHLDSTHSSELTLDHYTFSKKVDLGEVLDGVIVSEKLEICVWMNFFFSIHEWPWPAFHRSTCTITQADLNFTNGSKSLIWSPQKGHLVIVISTCMM